MNLEPLHLHLRGTHVGIRTDTRNIQSTTTGVKSGRCQIKSKPIKYLYCRPVVGCEIAQLINSIYQLIVRTCTTQYLGSWVMKSFMIVDLDYNLRDDWIGENSFKS